jgi:hypothetical protein
MKHLIGHLICATIFIVGSLYIITSIGPAYRPAVGLCVLVLAMAIWTASAVIPIWFMGLLGVGGWELGNYLGMPLQGKIALTTLFLSTAFWPVTVWAIWYLLTHNDRI